MRDVNLKMGRERHYVNDAAAERIKCFENQNWLQDKKLSVQIYDNALLFPGDSTATAGMYVDNKLLPETRLNAYLNVPSSIAADSKCQVDVLNEPVIYIGVLYDCWGHCITDEMKFLWVFLNEAVLPAQFRGAKCVYAHCLKGHSMPKNFMALLSSIGVPESRIIPVSNPTILKSCCIPDECFWTNDTHTARYYTKEYSQLVEAICSRVKKAVNNLPRKVYLTRTGWPKWEFGEINIERAFARAGYEVVHPEKLTFEELVTLMQNVDCLASTHGSCAHNSLFMRPGGELIIIRKNDFDNLYQFAINQIRKLKCTYVDANLSLIFWNSKEPNTGPFFMYYSRYLARFMGHKRPHFPVILFVRYLCFCVFLKAVRFLSPFWAKIKDVLGIQEFRLLKWP